MVFVGVLVAGRAIYWASALYSIGKVPSTGVLMVVLVCVKSNLVQVSIFLALVMAFASFVLESGCGVALCCCSHGFLGLSVAYKRSFMDLTCFLQCLICKCQGLLSDITLNFKTSWGVE